AVEYGWLDTRHTECRSAQIVRGWRVLARLYHDVFGSMPVPSALRLSTAGQVGRSMVSKTALRRDQPPMSVVHRIFMRMFGRPQGILGRLGGFIMARSNQQCAAWVIDLLDIQPHDSVLEVGFGPGVGIQLLARSASAGYVAGVDYSEAMVAQATARNGQVIESGQVDLRHGTVERLPFADHTFNKALAVNSMQVWPDA